MKVWKFHGFSVNQILREISFGECRSSKTAVDATLEALYFVNWVDSSLQNVPRIHKKQNGELLNVLKWHILRL